MNNFQKFPHEPEAIAAKFNKPVYAAMATFLIYSIFILLRLQQFNFNPSSFVVAGDRGTQKQYLPESFVVLGDSDGYDGQYYYGLAVSPFSPDPVSTGITGIGAYRHQRIFYPFVVWVLSFGKREYVPQLLIAVNLAGLCLISWLSATFLKLINRSSLWGILVSLYPGYLFTLSRDLGEIVAASLILIALLCFVKARFAIASLALSLGVMTRETALIVGVGAILSAILVRREDGMSRSGTFLPFLLPAGVYLIWQLILWTYWGNAPFMTAGGLIGIPMAGFLRRVAAVLSRWNLVDQMILLDFLFILAFVFAVLYYLRASGSPRLLKICFVISGIMVFSLSDQIWMENLGYYRAAADLFLFGYLVLLSTSTIVRIPLAILSAIVWLEFAYFQVFYP